jgi:hypothetical protein
VFNVVLNIALAFLLHVILNAVKNPSRTTGQ